MLMNIICIKDSGCPGYFEVYLNYRVNSLSAIQRKVWAGRNL